MTDYQLLTYRGAGEAPRAGLRVAHRIIDIASALEAPAYVSTIGILEAWDTAQPQLRALAASATSSSGIAFDETLLLAPVLAPSAIYCAGANYSDHVAEMARGQGREPEPDPHALGLKPWHFIKASRSIVGPGVDVTLPPASRMVDWEIELVAVIGRRTKDIAIDDALSAIAGYTIANDLSCRDIGWRPPMPQTSPFYSDWLAHKSFDGSCPLGPWIVPADQIGDAQGLALRLSRNGNVMQDSNTSKMIFTIAEQIAQLSARITLYPGDLVLTGTPAGVGAGRNEFLADGDEITLWCEGIGTLSHRMVAAVPAAT
jgi:2-keto-4-pentenoate hydratase/2-oxohepta-3-ene-1,7-dioic acid hydratase in catechol pathway